MTTGMTTDFWGELDTDVLRCLEGRADGLSSVEIGHKIGISADAVQSVLTMLARQGRVRLHCTAYAEPVGGPPSEGR